jgi:hypothetical protein
LEIKNNVTFSFLFLPENISYPLRSILGFIAQGFHSFIVSPEIYSNWNRENIAKLSQELNKFLLLKKKMPHLYFGQMSGDDLKKIST